MELKGFVNSAVVGFLSEEKTNQLPNIITKVGHEYSKEYNKTQKNLNNGYCEDIAYDVIEKIGGESSETFIIDDGWFWDDDEYSEYKTLTGEYWKIDNLKKYGKPYFGYDRYDWSCLDIFVWKTL